MKTIRKLTKEEVTFTLTCESEDLPILGDILASGDDALDKETADEVQAQLDAGNEWAWCCAKVTATWEDWSADEYLGGVSCKNEEDFRVGDKDYFDTMCDEALDRLNAQIAKVYEKLSKREENDKS